MNNRLTIVVPLYRDFLDPYEKVALKSMYDKLCGKYPIVAVVPRDMEFDNILSLFPQIEFRRLPQECFDGRAAYNALMLNPIFYNLFSDSDFILIYQTDCYLFEDRLMEFVEMDYDYIGAPWITKSRWRHLLTGAVWRVKNLLNRGRGRYRVSHSYRVGNGGFSLRKVSAMHNVTTRYGEEVRKWLDNNAVTLAGEDVFLCLWMSDYLKIPNYKIALKFAFDMRPDLAFKVNGKRLPMAAHAWQREEAIGFWGNYIKFDKE